MKELTQEKSRIHASIVTDALATYRVARDMNEFTQELRRIHASIVKRDLAGHHIASNMKKDTQETVFESEAIITSSGASSNSR